MDDIRKRLTGEDPLASEPPPDRLAFDRMRRVVVAAGRESRRPPLRFPRGSWLAAAAVIAVIALGSQRFQHDAPRTTPSSAASAQPDGGTAESRTPSRRQVQFVTPGGTRVIWILNEEFDEGSHR